MPIIDMHTKERQKVISQSQPLRVDWLIFWTLVSGALVVIASFSALIWLGRLAWRML